MQRRDFLKLTQAGVILSAVPSLHALEYFEKEAQEYALMLIDQESCADALVDPDALKPRMGDIIAKTSTLTLIKSLYARISRVQKTIGYGHFNTLNFDEMLYIGRNYPKVGNFTQEEIDYCEELFYEKATTYGFYGTKVITDITHAIHKNDIKKISCTGHYLFKGEAIVKYEKIVQEMGNKVVLTSGVRNVVKQIYLFLNKTLQTGGNLSIASRSLAPAGYSYHGVSDFDIGKVGFGARNFTSEFARTFEYQKLTELGYIDIRYPKNNPYGVRFEPWHIKVNHNDIYT